MHIRRVIMIIAIGNSEVRVGMTVGITVGRIIESHRRRSRNRTAPAANYRVRVIKGRARVRVIEGGGGLELEGQGYRREQGLRVKGYVEVVEITQKHIGIEDGEGG